MQRRDFLRASVATVTSLCTGACGEASEPLSPRDAVVDPERFPQSVASGDPSPTTVVLWTRVHVPGDPAPQTLELELFHDEALEEMLLFDDARFEITALAEHDHCVKVRVDALEPGRHYWYRFVHRGANGHFVSTPVGRTKTAPLTDSTAPVRFAVVSCQDYIGRYYNAYAHLATQELDFFVHLGDYIYETTGDPSFQSAATERHIVFDDLVGALSLGTDDATYHAARSLDNYRQLYRTVRTDQALQRAHQAHPMIATWDDHEFSNDCHGATATYTNGRIDETDIERRKNANQAWFEYMPVDDPHPGFIYDRNIPPPDDLTIHRDFVFGRNLHLVLTDLRSRRTDHLIDEATYPGTVLVDQDTLEASGGIPTFASPYVPDIDTFGEGSYAALLRAVAELQGDPTEQIRGPISASWLQAIIEEAADPNVSALDEATLAALPLGISAYDLGKASSYDSLGSRYLVAARAFTRYSEIAYAASGGASEDLLGPAQEHWFREVMAASTTTWRVWGNAFCLTPLQFDISDVPGIPSALARPFILNADDWNGAPNRRSALLRHLASIGNVVAVTGDIHSFFAGTVSTSDGTQEIVEFVGGSISSSNFSAVVRGQIENNPALANIEGLDLLAAALPSLLSGPRSPNPRLAFADTDHHGYLVVEVTETSIYATAHLHPIPLLTSEQYDSASLDALFSREEFRVDSGSTTLWRKDGEQWLAWDIETRTWV